MTERRRMVWKEDGSMRKDGEKEKKRGGEGKQTGIIIKGVLKNLLNGFVCALRDRPHGLLVKFNGFGWVMCHRNTISYSMRWGGSKRIAYY